MPIDTQSYTPHRAKPIYDDKQHILRLKEKKNNLDKELQNIAFQIADLGKKMYELKEELRITNIKLEKINLQKRIDEPDIS